MKRNRFAHALCGAMLAAIVAGDVAAQLEEVIVTARKREESLQDVPVVVSAIGAETIDRFRATSIADITELVPGLNTDVGAAGFQTVNLRGIQSSSVSASIDQAVSVNLDGVQSSNGYAFRIGQFDLAQIEVLKGPQALFFGKNSPGGIIAIRTNNPTEEFYSRVQAGYEFTSERPYLDAVVAGPLSDEWGGRLTAYHSDSSGYASNTWPEGGDDAPSFEELNLRGTLQYEANRFDATVKANYYDYASDSFHWTQEFACTEANRMLNPGSDCEFSDEFSSQPAGPEILSGNPFIERGTALSEASPLLSDSPHSDQEAHWLSLEMNYDIDDIWSLASITGWSEIVATASGNPLPGAAVFVLGQETEIDNLSQELRLSGSFDSFRVLLGAFADDRSIDYLGTVVVPTPRPGLQLLYPDTLQTIESDSWALFAQSDIYLSEEFTLSLGARYTEETKEFSGRNLNDGAFLLPQGRASLTGELHVPIDTMDEDNLSPEFTLSYHPEESILLFASWREGFKSGSFNFSSTANPLFVLTPPGMVGRNDISYGPESAQGFEVGAKLMLAGDTLRLNAAAFSYEYDDLQLAAYDPNTVSTRTVNAAKASVEGAELELSWLPPVAGLTLFANLALLDSTYDEFLSDCSQWQIFVTGAAGGCNVDIDGNPATNAGRAGGLLVGTGYEAQDRSGDDLRLAANFAGTAGATYLATLANGLDFSAGLTAVYTGEQVTDVTNDPRGLADDYWLLHGSLGIGAPSESWRLDLIARNLTDEAAGTRSGSLPFSSDGQSIQAMFGSRNNPRTVSLQLTLRPELF